MALCVKYSSALPPQLGGKLFGSGRLIGYSSSTSLPVVAALNSLSSGSSETTPKLNQEKGFYPSSFKRSRPTRTDYTFTSTNRELEMEKLSDEQRKLLAESWREINGRDDWVGMLDPMDPLLRRELIRYGEMAQSCYDAFDNDPFSKYCGSCKYEPDEFFDLLGIGTESGYEVTRYLYATIDLDLPNFFRKSPKEDAWTANTNWMGYVAVSDDETSRRIGRRDINVAWRGTVTRLEWVADMMNFLVPVSSEGIPCPDPDVKVQSGFIDLYTDKVVRGEKKLCKHSARERILAEVIRLVDKYRAEEISITLTGHSLGAALAVLSAYDIAEMGISVSAAADGRRIPVCVFSFSGPRVGNRRFKERMEELGVKVLRVVNVHDMVPKVPGVLVNEHMPEIIRRLVEWLPWSYSHVGSLLELDHKDSPFLKENSKDLTHFHNMEAHLHLLDGYHGKGQSFSLTSERDPALVNKASDFLKDDQLVPPEWRQDENKGLVRDEDGQWVQPERSMVDDYVPDIHYYLDQLANNLKAKIGRQIQSKTKFNAGLQFLSSLLVLRYSWEKAFRASTQGILSKVKINK